VRRIRTSIDLAFRSGSPDIFFGSQRPRGADGPPRLSSARPGDVAWLGRWLECMRMSNVSSGRPCYPRSGMSSHSRRLEICDGWAACPEQVECRPPRSPHHSRLVMVPQPNWTGAPDCHTTTEIERCRRRSWSRGLFGAAKPPYLYPMSLGARGEPCSVAAVCSGARPSS
jgi:hypothetical protein